MFPYINNISDILPIVSDKPEFIVAQREEYDVINYVISKPDTFNSIETLECRGIKFDKSGRVLARPLHKFFNMGENEFSSESMVSSRFNQPHVILEKLDGSMIHPAVIDDQIRLMTKMGITDTSAMAEEFISNKLYYNDFMIDLDAQNYTPIFEFISPKNQIVVSYSEENLILLAIRHKNTGNYISYDDMLNLAMVYNIPVVNHIDPFEDINEFKKYISTLEGEEGFVICWDDGYRVKVKSEWYLVRHKSKDLINFEYKTVQMILDEKDDDLIPLLQEADIKKLNDLKAFVEKGIEIRQAAYKLLFDEIKDWSKKEFSLSPLYKTLTAEVRSAMFSMYNQVSPREIAVNNFKKFSMKESTWKEFRKNGDHHIFSSSMGTYPIDCFPLTVEDAPEILVFYDFIINEYVCFKEKLWKRLIMDLKEQQS